MKDRNFLLLCWMYRGFLFLYHKETIDSYFCCAMMQQNIITQTVKVRNFSQVAESYNQSSFFTKWYLVNMFYLCIHNKYFTPTELTSTSQWRTRTSPTTRGNVFFLKKRKNTLFTFSFPKKRKTSSIKCILIVSFSESRRLFPPSSTAWTTGPNLLFWWATWDVPTGTSCQRNSLWNPSPLSWRACWEGEQTGQEPLSVYAAAAAAAAEQHPGHMHSIHSVLLQGRHLPEGLRRCWGGGRLRQPRPWHRHSAGEPPLPCGWGGQGQGCLWKQG